MLLELTSGFIKVMAFVFKIQKAFVVLHTSNEKFEIKILKI